MFIIETLQHDGSWWPFRYGAITGEPARFETVRTARAAYIIWTGGRLRLGKWRVVAAN